MSESDSMNHRELVVYGGDPVPPPPPPPGALGAAVRRTAAAAGRPMVKAVGVLLAFVLLSIGGLTVSGAVFNDEFKVGVSVASASLDIDVDGAQGNPTIATWDLGATNLKPGDSVTVTKQVHNAGTIPAVVTASMVGLGPTKLGAQIDATLSAAPSGSPVVTKTGKANGATLGAFTVPGGASVPLTVTLTLPASTGDSWQRLTDSLTLTLSAVQE